MRKKLFSEVSPTSIGKQQEGWHGIRKKCPVQLAPPLPSPLALPSLMVLVINKTTHQRNKEINKNSPMQCNAIQSPTIYGLHPGLAIIKKTNK
jgi:hypothetical protein